MEVGAGGKNALPKPHSRQGYVSQMPGRETTESGSGGTNEPNPGNFMVSNRQDYGLSHTCCGRRSSRRDGRICRHA